MNLKRSKYTGVDFEFKPYSLETVKKEDDSWERQKYLFRNIL